MWYVLDAQAHRGKASQKSWFVSYVIVKSSPRVCTLVLFIGLKTRMRIIGFVLPPFSGRRRTTNPGLGLQPVLSPREDGLSTE